MLDQTTVVRLLNEDEVADRVKVEDLLSVALGSRPAALLVVPPELPRASVIGQAIDHSFSRSYMGLPPPGQPPWTRLSWSVRAALARLFRSPVAYKAFLVRDAFEREVRDSDSYRALVRWAGVLGLSLNPGQVRPTIDEIYVGKGREVAARAYEMQMMRHKMRHKFLRQYREGGGAFRVFPEESSPDYARGVGTLLGYPPCCVDRYVELRSGDEPVENLAAAALETAEPDILSHFARDFIPCSPTCRRAAEVGTRMLDRLDAVDPRLATLQRRAFADNVDRVRRFPDIIKERQEQIQKKWQDMWVKRNGPGAEGGPRERF